MKKVLLFMVVFLSVNLFAQSVKHPCEVVKSSRVYASVVSKELRQNPPEKQNNRKQIMVNFDKKFMQGKMNEIRMKYLTPEQREAIMAKDQYSEKSEVVLILNTKGGVENVTLNFGSERIFKMFTNEQMQKLYDAFWNIEYPVKLPGKEGQDANNYSKLKLPLWLGAPIKG